MENLFCLPSREIRIQIELLRNAISERSLEPGLALCTAGLVIAQTNPHLSEEEQKLLFVEMTYGKDLADRVRGILLRDDHESALCLS